MSWTNLAPAPKAANGRSMVSVYVRKKASGEVTSRFSFSDFLQKDLKDPRSATIQVGEGEHDGQLRLVFHPSEAGDFACKPFGKGGFSLLLSSLPGAPDHDHGTEPCRLVSQVPAEAGGGEVIIELPLASWNPPPRPIVRDPPPPPKPAAPGRPLDAVEYLTRKGRKIAALAEGRWSLDGDTVVKGVVVKLVNQHRAKEGLDPLSADCIC